MFRQRDERLVHPGGQEGKPARPNCAMRAEARGRGDELCPTCLSSSCVVAAQSVSCSKQIDVFSA